MLKQSTPTYREPKVPSWDKSFSSSLSVVKLVRRKKPVSPQSRPWGAFRTEKHEIFLRFESYYWFLRGLLYLVSLWACLGSDYD